MRKITSYPDAYRLGKIGGINVYVNMKGDIDWPTGRIAITLDNIIVKVFQTLDWIANPIHDVPDRKVRVGIDEFYIINKHSEIVKEILVKDYIRDTMYSYLIMCHLLQDGYSMSKHKSWASYLVTRISRILKEESSIKILMA